MNNNSKRILVDIGHPAHVHLFRNAIRIWLEHGHSIVITIRDKDIIKMLLGQYGLTYSIASIARKGTIGLAYELLEHDWGVLRLALKNKSQLLVGTSVAISHVARITGAKSIVFNEDNAPAVRAFAKLAYPLAHAIATPSCLREDYGDRHYIYDGYQKLAYLHPNYFIPNPEVLNKLGVLPGESYFILRFVSFQAAHDRGETGLSVAARESLIRMLSKKGSVFITSEGPLPEQLECYRIPISVTEMHDALYYATLFVGDSQTMTAEAAILGTPAIRNNSFVGRISYLDELEHRYQLTFGFTPGQEAQMFERISDLLSRNDLKSIWKERRETMLSEKIDVTAWMVNFVEQYTERKN